MIAAIGNAMIGMASAVRQFDRASASIARPEPADPVGDRVDGRGLPPTGSAAELRRGSIEQITAQHSVAANVATVRTADEMIGTLIDIVA